MTILMDDELPTTDMRPEQLDFYATLGFTLSQWAHVEEGMLGLFWRAMGPKADIRKLAAVYYSAATFKGKLDMVDSAFALIDAGPKIAADWKKLKERLRDRADLRNQLAHHMAIGYLGPESLTYKLQPHRFNVRKNAQGKPLIERTAKDIEAVRRKISELFEGLRSLSEKLDEFNEAARTKGDEAP